MDFRVRLQDRWSLACLRRYLHRHVTDVKYAQESVELLSFQMQVCLETLETSGAEEAYQP